MFNTKNKTLKKIFIFLALLFSIFNCFSQEKKIKILSSDISKVDEENFPNAVILIGNVKIAHDGATLECKKALFYKNKNIFKAIGEVVMEQGDSIIHYSDFANYNGNSKIAKSWGNVEVNNKEMKLSTDTLYFNRKKQVIYYPNNGTIQNKSDKLQSKTGIYDAKTKKFTAKTNVNVTTPENTLKSDHLDYYTNSKLIYLYGKSTITNLKDNSKIYAERGFYNTNNDISYFVKNTKLTHKNLTIFADSIYYDKKKGFASATNKIRVIDTINNIITKGNYAEIFEKKDSLFITNKAVGIIVKDKDSTYIHGDTIMVTGKPDKRIMKIYNNVKIFKSDLQGKCDSIHSSQVTGITKMFKNPVLWLNKSQITGEHIQFLSDLKTNKLDSLKILNNGFMVQKDSLNNDSFNQIKGRNIYGKFKNNKIETILVKGNAESLFFNVNEKNKKIETITQEMASDIEFTFKNNEIYQTKYINKSEGKTYPPSKFPKESYKLKGFIWREDERPKTKNDIFIKNNKKSSLKVEKEEILKAKELLTKENLKIENDK